MTDNPLEPMNDYGLPRPVFNLFGDAIAALTNDFDEISVAEVETRDNGLALTLWSTRYQHQIDIDGVLNSVTLSILPLDGVTAVPVFTAEADRLSSWLRLQHLVMGAEGYATEGDGVAEILREHGIHPLE